MREFGAEAVRNYLGVIGMVAVFIGVAGISAAFVSAPMEAAAINEPLSTVIAWQAQ